MNNKFNGWKNWETYCFYSSITSEEPDYEYALEMAFDSEHEYELSKKLEEWACFMASDVLTSYEYTHRFIESILDDSIMMVNFYEVAERLWKTRQEAIREHDGEEE